LEEARQYRGIPQGRMKQDLSMIIPLPRSCVAAPQLRARTCACPLPLPPPAAHHSFVAADLFICKSMHI
jgi:hypothetical protein